MNKNNLRFLVSSFIGYWTDNIKGWSDKLSKEGENTPYIPIGKCSPL
jgi:hypothetical protein